MSSNFRPYRQASFNITIIVDRKAFTFKITCILKALGTEHYELVRGNRRFVFETNRPIIERRGLKNFPYTWKLIEGTISHHSYQEDIITALDKYLRGDIGSIG